MIMRIHIVQHEVFEAPGAYLDWALDRKYKVTISKVYDGDQLPVNADEIDLLIVMGGPQSPSTTIDECPHFEAKSEKALILDAVKSGKGVIGVCLGAQLIGQALDATFSQSPEKEIGVFPISLTDAGLKDQNIAHFGDTLNVGHWHNDMPGLTSTSSILATSEGCPRQIISYAPFVYGFQCHMEFTLAVVELLIAEEKAFLNSNHSHQYVQKPQEIRNFDFQQMNLMLYQFLDNLVASYQRRT